MWAACGVSGALYTLIFCVTGCPCFFSCFYRSKMRQQYTLDESPCGDCLVHCFCEYCALCQEYRELQNRGFDMVIGNQSLLPFRKILVPLSFSNLKLKIHIVNTMSSCVCSFSLWGIVIE